MVSRLEYSWTNEYCNCFMAIQAVVYAVVYSHMHAKANEVRYA